MPALGCTLSAASLIWVFHYFNFRQTFADLKMLDWRYVTPAVIFDLGVYLRHEPNGGLTFVRKTQLPLEFAEKMT